MMSYKNRTICKLYDPEKNFYQELLYDIEGYHREILVYINNIQENELRNSIPSRYQELSKYLEQNVRFFPYYEIVNLIDTLQTNSNILKELTLPQHNFIRDILALVKIPEAIDSFKQELSILEEYFSLDCNIKYIGCGRIPILAELISKKQHQGRVDVYDKAILQDSALKETDLLLQNSHLNLQRQYLWHIPHDSQLMIFDDVCPTTPYFIERLMECDKVKGIFKLCNGAYELYNQEKLLTRQQLCDLALEKYESKGLKYDSKRKILIKTN